MIKPVNGHLLIEPIKHEGFMASQRETYEEVGIVVAVASEVKIPIGVKVYFDSWLAARFPSEDPDKPYWLVKEEDIRAISE